MAIIEEEFATLYGIEELAERLEVRAPHLIREFTRVKGVSPGKYLRKCRIDHAKHLLSESDLPIKLITVMCGYAEPGYFSRVFKTETGMTPGSYRSKYYNGNAGIEGRISRAEQAMYL